MNPEMKKKGTRAVASMLVFLMVFMPFGGWNPAPVAMASDPTAVETGDSSTPTQTLENAQEPEDTAPDLNDGIASTISEENPLSRDEQFFIGRQQPRWLTDEDEIKFNIPRDQNGERFYNRIVIYTHPSSTSENPVEIAIVGSERVSSEAFQKALTIIGRMSAGVSPKIMQAMAQNQNYVSIIGERETAADLPEAQFAPVTDPEIISAGATNRSIAVSEINLRQLPDTRYREEQVLAREYFELMMRVVPQVDSYYSGEWDGAYNKYFPTGSLPTVPRWSDSVLEAGKSSAAALFNWMACSQDVVVCTSSELQQKYPDFFKLIQKLFLGEIGRARVVSTTHALAGYDDPPENTKATINFNAITSNLEPGQTVRLKYRLVNSELCQGRICPPGGGQWSAPVEMPGNNISIPGLKVSGWPGQTGYGLGGQTQRLVKYEYMVEIVDPTNRPISTSDTQVFSIAPPYNPMMISGYLTHLTYTSATFSIKVADTSNVMLRYRKNSNDPNAPWFEIQVPFESLVPVVPQPGDPDYDPLNPNSSRRYQINNFMIGNPNGVPPSAPLQSGTTYDWQVSIDGIAPAVINRFNTQSLFINDSSVEPTHNSAVITSTVGKIEPGQIVKIFYAKSPLASESSWIEAGGVQVTPNGIDKLNVSATLNGLLVNTDYVYILRTYKAPGFPSDLLEESRQKIFTTELHAPTVDDASVNWIWDNFMKYVMPVVKLWPKAIGNYAAQTITYFFSPALSGIIGALLQGLNIFNSALAGTRIQIVNGGWGVADPNVPTPANTVYGSPTGDPTGNSYGYYFAQGGGVLINTIYTSWGYSAAQIRHVMEHEIGHNFGFDHANHATQLSVMSYAYWGDMTGYDVALLRMLYGNGGRLVQGDGENKIKRYIKYYWNEILPPLVSRAAESGIVGAGASLLRAAVTSETDGAEDLIQTEQSTDYFTADPPVGDPSPTEQMIEEGLEHDPEDCREHNHDHDVLTRSYIPQPMPEQLRSFMEMADAEFQNSMAGLDPVSLAMIEEAALLVSPPLTEENPVTEPTPVFSPTPAPTPMPSPTLAPNDDPVLGHPADPWPVVSASPLPSGEVFFSQVYKGGAFSFTVPGEPPPSQVVLKSEAEARQYWTAQGLLRQRVENEEPQLPVAFKPGSLWIGAEHTCSYSAANCDVTITGVVIEEGKVKVSVKRSQAPMGGAMTDSYASKLHVVSVEGEVAAAILGGMEVLFVNESEADESPLTTTNPVSKPEPSFSPSPNAVQAGCYYVNFSLGQTQGCGYQSINNLNEDLRDAMRDSLTQAAQILGIGANDIAAVADPTYRDPFTGERTVIPDGWAMEDTAVIWTGSTPVMSYSPLPSPDQTPANGAPGTDWPTPSPSQLAEIVPDTNLVESGTNSEIAFVKENHIGNLGGEVQFNNPDEPLNGGEAVFNPGVNSSGTGLTVVPPEASVVPSVPEDPNNPDIPGEPADVSPVENPDDNPDAPVDVDPAEPGNAALPAPQPTDSPLPDENGTGLSLDDPEYIYGTAVDPADYPTVALLTLGASGRASSLFDDGAGSTGLDPDTRNSIAARFRIDPDLIERAGIWDDGINGPQLFIGMSQPISPATSDPEIEELPETGTETERVSGYDPVTGKAVNPLAGISGLHGEQSGDTFSILGDVKYFNDSPYSEKPLKASLWAGKLADTPGEPYQWQVLGDLPVDANGKIQATLPASFLEWQGNGWNLEVWLQDPTSSRWVGMGILPALVTAPTPSPTPSPSASPEVPVTPKVEVSPTASPSTEPGSEDTEPGVAVTQNLNGSFSIDAKTRALLSPEAIEAELMRQAPALTLGSPEENYRVISNGDGTYAIMGDIAEPPAQRGTASVLELPDHESLDVPETENLLSSAQKPSPTFSRDLNQVTAIPSWVISSYGLNADFYTQWIETERGIPVFASSKVSTAALIAARDIINMMMKNVPESVAAKMRELKSRVTVMGPLGTPRVEYMTNVPEYAHLAFVPPGAAYWNARYRGAGGTPGIPVTLMTEENLLAMATDSHIWNGIHEGISLHEYMHMLKLNGLSIANPVYLSSHNPARLGFHERLSNAYTQALGAGLLNNTYAATNIDEFAAMMAESYFNVNIPGPVGGDGVHNHIWTRAALQAYLPDVYGLYQDVFEGAPVQGASFASVSHTVSNPVPGTTRIDFKTKLTAPLAAGDTAKLIYQKNGEPGSVTVPMTFSHNDPADGRPVYTYQANFPELTWATDPNGSATYYYHVDIVSALGVTKDTSSDQALQLTIPGQAQMLNAQTLEVRRDSATIKFDFVDLISQLPGEQGQGGQVKIFWWNDAGVYSEKFVPVSSFHRQGRHFYLTTALEPLAPGNYEYRTEIYDANQNLLWSVDNNNPGIAAAMHFTITPTRSIADKLAISFDVNDDGQVNSADVSLIDEEQQTNPSAAVFANWVNITTWIQMFLDAQGATAKLEVLKGLWGIRRDFLNPILKKSIFGFLAQQTLLYSAQPGATTTGIFNVPIAEMLVSLKEDEQNQAATWYPQIRNYILSNVQQFAPFAQEKVLALWDVHKVLVNYSAQSFPPGGGAGVSSLHLNYLDGMKNLLDGNAPPFIGKTIDMVEIRNGMMKGSGYGVHVVSTHYEPFGTIGNFAHEAFHIAMSSSPLNYLDTLAPPIWPTFVSEAGSNPGNFVSSYAQMGGVHENLAEVGSALTKDTLGWFNYAAKRAVDGNSLPPGSGYGILLEQFISLLSLPIYPQHPDMIETTLMDAQGNIQHGSFPITRGSSGEITRMTILGQSYAITYKPNGRIATVSLVRVGGGRSAEGIVATQSNPVDPDSGDLENVDVAGQPAVLAEDSEVVFRAPLSVRDDEPLVFRSIANAGYPLPAHPPQAEAQTEQVLSAREELSPRESVLIQPAAQAGLSGADSNQIIHPAVTGFNRMSLLEQANLLSSPELGADHRMQLISRLDLNGIQALLGQISDPVIRAALMARLEALLEMEQNPSVEENAEAGTLQNPELSAKLLAQLGVSQESADPALSDSDPSDTATSPRSNN